jgi:hypothetical protein
MTSDISVDTIQNLFGYDPDTGALYWKVARSNVVKIGVPVTRVSPSTGYIRVSVNKKQLVAHRVAWVLSTGAWPTGVIDHINGIKTDNRLINLRDVPRADNCLNRVGVQKNKKLGDLGVFFDKRSGSWYAQLCYRGKVLCLGTFLSSSEASTAVAVARKKILGQVAYA